MMDYLLRVGISTQRQFRCMIYQNGQGWPITTHLIKKEKFSRASTEWTIEEKCGHEKVILIYIS